MIKITIKYQHHHQGLLALAYHFIYFYPQELAYFTLFLLVGALGR